MIIWEVWSVWVRDPWFWGGGCLFNLNFCNIFKIMTQVSELVKINSLLLPYESGGV